MFGQKILINRLQFRNISIDHPNGKFPPGKCHVKKRQNRRQGTIASFILMSEAIFYMNLRNP